MPIILPFACRRRRFRCGPHAAGALLLAALVLAPPPVSARAAAVLIVDSLSGEAVSDRGGDRQRLRPGESLREFDGILADGRDARINLVLARDGQIDLGGNTELIIDRLPTSMDDADRRTELSLRSGYLHVVWSPPDPSEAWAFTLSFGGLRATLRPGEYFFERRDGRLTACIADGWLGIASVAGEGRDTLRAGACHDLRAVEAAKRDARVEADFEAMRRAASTLARAAATRVAAGAAAEASAAPEPVPESAPAAMAVAELASPAPAAVTRSIVMTGPAAAPLPPIADAGATANRPPAAQALPALPPTATTVAAPIAAPSPASGPMSSPATPPPPRPLPQTLPRRLPAASSGVPHLVGPSGEPANWTVLLGSFGEAINAERLAARLIAAGHPAVVRVTEVGGRIWHSVQVRGLASEAAALRVSADIRAAFRLDGIRVKKID